jgi:predicted transcriptional regulator
MQVRANESQEKRGFILEDVTLNGVSVYRDAFFADTETGEVHVWVRDTDGKILKDKDGSLQKTVLKGTVNIQYRELPGPQVGVLTQGHNNPNPLQI